MPLLTAGGYLDSGTLGTELTYVTRRNFVPKMIVQLYKSAPALSHLLMNGKITGGGVNSVSIPVQGTSFVTGQWVGYPGTFNQPANTAATTLAEYQFKMYLIPIPFLGTEGLLQQDHDIIPLIQARMNDAENVACQDISTELYANLTDTSKIIGLLGAVDDGTNLVTYANINRTTNTWWKSQRKDQTGNDPTRELVMQDIMRVQNAVGEMPTYGLTDPGTWVKLANDFLGLERYVVEPSGGFDTVRGGFRAIEVSGLPIYADPYCSAGEIYYINDRYLHLQLHQSAAFAFTGFESLIPNSQLGYVGLVVVALELINSKPAASARSDDYNTITL